MEYVTVRCFSSAHSTKYRSQEVHYCVPSRDNGSTCARLHNNCFNESISDVLTPAVLPCVVQQLLEGVGPVPVVVGLGPAGLGHDANVVQRQHVLDGEGDAAKTFLRRGVEQEAHLNRVKGWLVRMAAPE